MTSSKQDSKKSHEINNALTLITDITDKALEEIKDFKSAEKLKEDEVADKEKAPWTWNEEKLQHENASIDGLLDKALEKMSSTDKRLYSRHFYPKIYSSLTTTTEEAENAKNQRHFTSRSYDNTNITRVLNLPIYALEGPQLSGSSSLYSFYAALQGEGIEHVTAVGHAGTKMNSDFLPWFCLSAHKNYSHWATKKTNSDWYQIKQNEKEQNCFIRFTEGPTYQNDKDQQDKDSPPAQYKIEITQKDPGKNELSSTDTHIVHVTHITADDGSAPKLSTNQVRDLINISAKTLDNNAAIAAHCRAGINRTLFIIVLQMLANEKVYQFIFNDKDQSKARFKLCLNEIQRDRHSGWQQPDHALPQIIRAIQLASNYHQARENDPKFGYPEGGSAKYDYLINIEQLNASRQTAISRIDRLLDGRLAKPSAFKKTRMKKRLLLKVLINKIRTATNPTMISNAITTAITLNDQIEKEKRQGNALKNYGVSYAKSSLFYSHASFSREDLEPFANNDMPSQKLSSKKNEHISKILGDKNRRDEEKFDDAHYEFFMTKLQDALDNPSKLSVQAKSTKSQVYKMLTGVLTDIQPSASTDEQSSNTAFKM
jgi:protein-tyrosine phosphatase